MSFLVLSDQTAGVAAPGADTDILAADVSLNSARNGAKVRLTVVLDTADVFKAVDDAGSEYKFNGGSNIAAGCVYAFDLPASSSRTYNFQVEGGTTVITSLLVEEVWDE